MTPTTITFPQPAEQVRPRAEARTAAPYLDPYLAGVGVGIALLLAFVLMGRGLGASGAFSSTVAAGVQAVAPEHANASPSYAPYLQGEGSPLADWLVLELIGAMIGGAVSARLAGRWRRTIERGLHVGANTRLLFAFGGGIVMGFGAKLARGCTSGLGLTGGALLAAGSWLFVLAAFAAGYAAAPLFRRSWR